MTPSYIINVTEDDFEYEVIQYSQQIPVVVDFWADWCIPCKTLGPILLELAEKNQGEFRLAKVDVDENPKLAQRFNVRGIPAVKAFKDGQVLAEFTGALSEPQVRKFLDQILPKPWDLLIEKGESLLTLEEWTRAEETFQQILSEHPQHPGALLGLAKSGLAQGQGAATLEILNVFPASREFSQAQQLRPLAEALAQDLSWIDDSDLLIDATYGRALRLIENSNLPAAMDGLLVVLKDNKHYRNNEARQVMVGLLEILGNENPLTRQYRTELASVLY
jgi:putative thioredoxin